MNQSVRRNRAIYFLLIIVVFTFGITSRQPWFPKLFYNYLGDALYASLIYVGVAFVFNTKSIKWVAITSLAFCYGVEFLQLYHAAWIDEIRSKKLGGLILGHGFLWSDLISYLVGVIFMMLLEKYFLLNRKKG